jgi:hypothetical protein
MPRIGFYIPEVKFLDDHDPRTAKGPALSYQQIADELNRRWPQFNRGQRTRGTVIDYYNRKRKQEDMVIRLVPLPKAISDTLSGDDIRRIIVSHTVPIGTKRA